MPSSISSSDNRLPKAPMGRMWALALVLFVVGLVGLELLWRSLGFTPSVTDDVALWAFHRQRVGKMGANDLVLLGRSRLHQAFVGAVFRERCPEAAYAQLCVAADHPLGTLRDIALTTDFSGVVVCSIASASLLPELWDQQEPYWRYYHHQWGPVKRLNRALRTKLEQHLTFLLPDVMPQRIGLSLLRGNVPRQWLWTHSDRTQTARYRRVDIARLTRSQLAKLRHDLERYEQLPGYKAWPAGLEHVEQWVQLIQQRGGRVLFLRSPTSGRYGELEQTIFPRERFWDLFAAQTKATTLHFEDHPVMAGFVCAEGAHLHYEDTHVFTAALADFLCDEGLLSWETAPLLQTNRSNPLEDQLLGRSGKAASPLSCVWGLAKTVTLTTK